MAVSEKRSWPFFVLIIPLFLVGLVLFRFFLSSVKEVLPECLFFRLTGLHCPGCGGTRSAEALVHFNLGEAIRQHAWFTGTVLLGLPVLLWMALTEKNKSLSGPCFSNYWLWFCLVSLIVYTITRNLPGMEWLAPR